MMMMANWRWVFLARRRKQGKEKEREKFARRLSELTTPSDEFETIRYYGKGREKPASQIGMCMLRGQDGTSTKHRFLLTQEARRYRYEVERITSGYGGVDINTPDGVKKLGVIHDAIMDKVVSRWCMLVDDIIPHSCHGKDGHGVCFAAGVLRYIELFAMYGVMDEQLESIIYHLGTGTFGECQLFVTPQPNYDILIQLIDQEGKGYATTLDAKTGGGMA